MAYGDSDAKLCQITVIRKYKNKIVAKGIARVPGSGSARLVWTPESDAVGYVGKENRLLGFVRVSRPAFEQSDEELAERILAAAK